MHWDVSIGPDKWPIFGRFPTLFPLKRPARPEKNTSNMADVGRWRHRVTSLQVLYMETNHSWIPFAPYEGLPCDKNRPHELRMAGTDGKTGIHRRETVINANTKKNTGYFKLVSDVPANYCLIRVEILKEAWQINNLLCRRRSVLIRGCHVTRMTFNSTPISSADVLPQASQTSGMAISSPDVGFRRLHIPLEWTDRIYFSGVQTRYFVYTLRSRLSRESLKNFEQKWNVSEWLNPWHSQPPSYTIHNVFTLQCPYLRI
jgi:hypothetical protein